MYKTIIVLAFNNKKLETIWKKCKRSHQLSFFARPKKVININKKQK